ncbi:hypothetical protein GCM10029992_43650 [Glycomyces albus]
MIEPEWTRLQASEDLAHLFEDPSDEQAWLRNVRRLVETYFKMEDPTRLEPHRTECLVTATLDDGTQLKGFIDRADVNGDGLVRLVDYKTGRRPPDRFSEKAIFQMKFYALVWWRTRGTVPKLLRLMYLGDARVLDYSPRRRSSRASRRVSRRYGRRCARPSPPASSGLSVRSCATGARSRSTARSSGRTADLSADDGTAGSGDASYLRRIH